MHDLKGEDQATEAQKVGDAGGVDPGTCRGTVDAEVECIRLRASDPTVSERHDFVHKPLNKDAPMALTLEEALTHSKPRCDPPSKTEYTT
jgi:hypothetical protein